METGQYGCVAFWELLFGFIKGKTTPMQQPVHHIFGTYGFALGSIYIAAQFAQLVQLVQLF